MEKDRQTGTVEGQQQLPVLPWCAWGEDTRRALEAWQAGGEWVWGGLQRVSSRHRQHAPCAWDWTGQGEEPSSGILPLPIQSLSNFSQPTSKDKQTYFLPSCPPLSHCTCLCLITTWHNNISCLSLWNQTTMALSSLKKRAAGKHEAGEKAACSLHTFLLTCLPTNFPTCYFFVTSLMSQENDMWLNRPPPPTRQTVHLDGGMLLTPFSRAGQLTGTEKNSLC